MRESSCRDCKYYRGADSTCKKLADYVSNVLPDMSCTLFKERKGILCIIKEFLEGLRKI